MSFNLLLCWLLSTRELYIDLFNLNGMDLMSCHDFSAGLKIGIFLVQLLNALILASSFNDFIHKRSFSLFFLILAFLPI